MATLHIINRREALGRCLTVLRAGDRVLLIEDGVYLLRDAGALCDAGTLPDESCALEDDARARGIIPPQGSATRLVSYREFVDLTLSHSPVVSW